MKLFISAGHYDDPQTLQIEDTGAVVFDVVEQVWNVKIRNEIKKILPQAIFVPDNISLGDTIKWINERCNDDDFALEVHLNAHKNGKFRGVEAYYSEDDHNAKIISKCVSESFGIPNRGTFHDSMSYVGSLGFLRKLNCPSSLVECCYITNIEDLKALKEGGCEKIAIGIKNALDIIVGEEKIRELQKKISLYKKLIELWKQLLSRSNN